MGWIGIRLKARELAADLHRVRSAPWPSSVAKAAAKQIDALADAAAPDCGRGYRARSADHVCDHECRRQWCAASRRLPLAFAEDGRCCLV